MKLEPISKMRLRAHGGVADRLKMLTYCRVCSAFEPPRACPETLSHIFEMGSGIMSCKQFTKHGLIILISFSKVKVQEYTEDRAQKTDDR
jgi:hypothetical protein